MAQFDKSGKETNTRCPSCGQDVFLIAGEVFDVTEAVCPECGAVFDKDTIECWSQTVWPYPSWDPDGEHA